MPSATHRAVESWLAANPLRRWLNKPGRRWWEAANATGVSTQAIGQWMLGQTYPSAPRLRALCELIGISEVDWFDWYQSRPSD